jgi:tetratricopeptide (TPR) repeat protein
MAGLLLEAQNKVPDAMARYESALHVDPRAAVAANNLAWLILQQGGNLDRALELARTAKAALPNRPEVNDTLGWILHKRGLSAMAVPTLTESVRVDPRTAAYHFHLGMAHAATGNVEQARASLKQALSLKLTAPDDAEARQALAAIAP